MMLNVKNTIMLIKIEKFNCIKIYNCSLNQINKDLNKYSIAKNKIKMTKM